MKPTDRPRFAENMRGTFSVYSMPVTEELLETWWRVLDRYTIDGVAAAFSFHLSDYRGFGHRAPTPADLVRALEETLPKAAQERADEILTDCRARMRGLNDKIGTLRANLDHGVIKPEQFRDRSAPLFEELSGIVNHPSYRRALQPTSFLEPATVEVPRRRTLVDRAIALIGRGKK